MKPIIQVRGLSERYCIGVKRARYGSLRESLVNAARANASAARLYGSFLRAARYRGRVRGMGFLLRRARHDHVIEADGLRFHFNHRVGGCYDALVARRQLGEQETHRFLGSVLAHPGPGRVTFVDVGANIGEIAIDMARRDRIEQVIAFEPHVECAKALAATAALNGLQGKVIVKPVALASSRGQVDFVFDRKRPNASHIAARDSDGQAIPCSTLDDETEGLVGSIIVKIDVEGAEPEVLKGARRLLARSSPLVVFEYNDSSRRSFSLEDVRGLLGAGYSLWRLRGDGLLDEDFTATWNCVAVHGSTAFASACRQLAVS